MSVSKLALIVKCRKVRIKVVIKTSKTNLHDLCFKMSKKMSKRNIMDKIKILK